MILCPTKLQSPIFYWTSLSMKKMVLWGYCLVSVSFVIFVYMYLCLLLCKWKRVARNQFVWANGFFSLATKAATFIQVKHRKKTNITFMIIVWNKILNLFVGALCFSVYKIVYNVYKNVNISALSILRGVATIDIELTSIDINQCDLSKIPKERATFDVFRGTHLCQPSTEVSPFVPMACNWQ